MMELSIGDTVTYLDNGKKMTGFVISMNDEHRTYLVYVKFKGRKYYDILNPIRSELLTSKSRTVLFEKYYKKLF